MKKPPPVPPHIRDHMRGALVGSKLIAEKLVKRLDDFSEEESSPEEELAFAADLTFAIDQMESVASYLLHRNDMPEASKEDWE